MECWLADPPGTVWFYEDVCLWLFLVGLFGKPVEREINFRRADGDEDFFVHSNANGLNPVETVISVNPIIIWTRALLFTSS